MVLFFYMMGRTVSLLSGRLHEFVSEANSSWNCSGRVVFGFEDTYTERARTQCGVCFLDIFLCRKRVVFTSFADVLSSLLN